jgi:hypothetical protein
MKGSITAKQLKVLDDQLELEAKHDLNHEIIYTVRSWLMGMGYSVEWLPKIAKSKDPCPKCKTYRWHAELRMGKDLQVIPILGFSGTVAWRYCHHCGYQEAGALSPEPWDPGEVFPMTAEREYQLLEI